MGFLVIASLEEYTGLGATPHKTLYYQIVISNLIHSPGDVTCKLRNNRQATSLPLALVGGTPVKEGDGPFYASVLPDKAKLGGQLYKRHGNSLFLPQDQDVSIQAVVGSSNRTGYYVKLDVGAMAKGTTFELRVTVDVDAHDVGPLVASREYSHG